MPETEAAACGEAPGAGPARSVRLLRLLARTAAASNEAASVEDALARVLGEACALLDWDVGHAWLPAGDGSGDFVPTGIWHPAADDRFARLRFATAGLRFGMSDALLARLFAGPAPIWAIAGEETKGPPTFQLSSGGRVEVGKLGRNRLPLAFACGLRSFFLVPIRVRDEAVGALELASVRREPVDAELIEALQHVGVQLGRLVERERAERSLRAREEHLRAILAALVDTPVVVVDRQARIVESFGSVRNRHGVAPETVLEVSPAEWLRPEQLRPMLDALAEVFASGEPRRLEARLDLPAGESWFDLRFYPLRDASGAVESVLCLSYDLTERKRLEQALLASERFARRLTEVSPVGIYRADPEGNPVHWSDRCAEIAGLPAGAGYERWLACVDPRDREPFLAAARQSIEAALPFEYEVRLLRPDGSTVWVLYQWVPDFDERGRRIGFVGTMTDITESKRAAEELARIRDRLGELVAERTAELERTHERLRRAQHLAAVGTFAAGIAHQINNPVGAILVAAQFAQERIDDDAVVGTALDHIVTDARRCRRIVRGVLEFARGDTGDRKRCDLNQLVRSAREQALDDVADRGASIELELADALPPIAANEPALDQVLANLVANALEAGARRIRLRSAAAPGEVRLEVCDDGRGIPPEHLPQVMDPFFTTRWESGGTGLGLSLAWGIVRGHGGDLELASEPGRGTTVTVRLPIAGEEEARGYWSSTTSPATACT